MNKTNRKGFTLAELLIVVAIIAVLVAIAIPVFTSQLHKSRVAADLANMRAYYAEIQADYQETGKVNDKALEFNLNRNYIDYKHLDGSVSSLKAGQYVIQVAGENLGYSIVYTCNDGDHTQVFTNVN